MLKYGSNQIRPVSIAIKKGYKDQSMGSFPIDFNISLVFEKCLHPKKPLKAEKGEGCAAFNT